MRHVTWTSIIILPREWNIAIPDIFTKFVINDFLKFLPRFPSIYSKKTSPVVFWLLTFSVKLVPQWHDLSVHMRPKNLKYTYIYSIEVGTVKKSLAWGEKWLTFLQRKELFKTTCTMCRYITRTFLNLTKYHEHILDTNLENFTEYTRIQLLSGLSSRWMASKNIYGKFWSVSLEYFIILSQKPKNFRMSVRFSLHQLGL